MTTTDTSDAKPVVYVVDDDESFRTGITRLLKAAGYDARGFGTAGDFLLEHTAKQAACVLLDVRMPGPSGLDLQEALNRAGEPIPIIFISGHGSIPASVRAMKAGAVDFLTKPVKREILLEAIQRAVSRTTETRAAREKLRAAKALYESLSERERQVFAGVAAGKLNKEIAAEFGTVERTVKAQRASLMIKMNARSVAELAQIAYQLQQSGVMPKDQRASA